MTHTMRTWIFVLVFILLTAVVAIGYDRYEDEQREDQVEQNLRDLCDVDPVFC